MRLIFVRHGDPDYEKDSLTEKGFREVEILSRRLCKLDVKTFYCSPLGRAKDTARPTLEKLGREAVICDFLQEFVHPVTYPDTGVKEPVPWDLMPSYWMNEPDYFDFEKWADTDLMQSGNIKSYYREVCEHFDRLLEKHGYVRMGRYYEVRKGNTDTLVFFCHFGMICVLLSHLLGISPVILWHGMCAAPTSVTTLYTEEREKGTAAFRCQSFGDLSHLYEAGEEPAFAARFCETYDSDAERH